MRCFDELSYHLSSQNSATSSGETMCQEPARSSSGRYEASILGTSVNNEDQQLPRRMSSITTFFRHCPSCGRRFEIRLVGKNLVRTERNTYPTTRTTHPDVLFPARFQRPGVGRSFVELEEKVRVTTKIEEFRYAYKCKHCGHQWVEERSEETQPSVEKRS